MVFTLIVDTLLLTERFSNLKKDSLSCTRMLAAVPRAYCMYVLMDTRVIAFPFMASYNVPYWYLVLQRIIIRHPNTFIYIYTVL